MNRQAIELLKRHTHAGHPLEPGHVIRLPPDLARWLIEAGVAQAQKTPPLPRIAVKNEDLK